MRTRLPQDRLWNHISTKTINLFTFCSKQHQKLTIYCWKNDIQNLITDYSRITVETTFLQKLLVCLLFNSKQHQKLTIYCRQ